MTSPNVEVALVVAANIAVSLILAGSAIREDIYCTKRRSSSCKTFHGTSCKSIVYVVLLLLPAAA